MFDERGSILENSCPPSPLVSQSSAAPSADCSFLSSPPSPTIKPENNAPPSPVLSQSYDNSQPDTARDSRELLDGQELVFEHGISMLDGFLERENEDNDKKEAHSENDAPSLVDDYSECEEEWEEFEFDREGPNLKLESWKEAPEYEREADVQVEPAGSLNNLKEMNEVDEAEEVANVME